MFLRFDRRLFEEQQEHSQGGGGQAGSGEAQQPDIRALFTEFQKTLIGEVDKRVNGINKEFKTQISKVNDGFNSRLDTLVTSLSSRQEDNAGGDDQHAAEEHQRQEQERQQQAQQRQQSRENSGSGNQGGEQHQERQQQQPRPNQKPQKDPVVLALEKKVADMEKRDLEREQASQKRAEEAERKETDALLRTEIAKHRFNSEQGPADFFSLTRGKIARGDDGELYGPEGASLAQYIEAEYSLRPFLHPRIQAGGSGAYASTSTSTGKFFDLDDIQPGMSAEKKDAARAAIVAARQQQQR